jgi:hypothetical protein
MLAADKETIAPDVPVLARVMAADSTSAHEYRPPIRKAVEELEQKLP